MNVEIPLRCLLLLLLIYYFTYKKTKRKKKHWTLAENMIGMKKFKNANGHLYFEFNLNNLKREMIDLLIEET